MLRRGTRLMTWREALFDQLAAQSFGGYGRSDSPATEPSALAALALASVGRWTEVRAVADWLAGFQGADGSVGVRATEPTPSWPTSLAVLTWLACRGGDASVYSTPLTRAVAWIREGIGRSPVRHMDNPDRHRPDAWPWVPGTHSWVEPTSFHTLALQAAGWAESPPVKLAVATLLDRQLPAGGFNYGNTVVLGNTLRPHVQPTGIALLALAGLVADDRMVAPSIAYLRRQLSPTTTIASLCWSVLGLAAHGVRIESAEEWLAAHYERVATREPSTHQLALLAQAALGADSLLIRLPREGRRTSPAAVATVTAVSPPTSVPLPEPQ